MTKFKSLLFLVLLTVLACGQSQAEFPLESPPTVTGTDPPDASTKVAVDAKVSATFSKAMDAATLTAATFTLTRAGTAVPATVTYAGTTATLAPAGSLATGALFTATITTGATDDTGHALAANYVWSFTTDGAPDTIPPTITFTNPADKATSIGIGTKVSAAFSEAMTPATLSDATFTLMSGATPVPGTVTYSGVTATFTPKSALAANEIFTATITTGAKDLAGNALAQSYVWAFTTTASPDVTPPTVIFTVPADGAAAVVGNATVQIAFDEPMDCATLNLMTFTLMQGAAPVPGTVTCVGATAIFTPTSPLAPNSIFTATVAAGVTDLAGNGLGASYVWSFTTSSALPDVTPPTVLFTVPADGANGVVVNTTLQIAFSEAVNCATLDVSTVTLQQGAVPVAGTVTCVGATATFTPTSALAPNAAFTATVTTGVTDVAGNAMTAAYAWGFSTSALLDVTPPTVTSTWPADGALNVAVNAPITAAFSEGMKAATITGATFTLTQGAIPVAGAVSYFGTTATFTPTVNLPTATQFTATLTTGVTDLAGNAMIADFVWTFHTGAPPTVISTNPTNGAQGVALNRKLDATFSVSMNPLTLDANTFTVAQGAIPIGGAVTYVGMTATFTPAVNYPINTVITATITTGAKDTNGNGLLNDYVWSFKTGAQLGQEPITLGAASTYAILAFNTVTNVNNPGTIVTGDLGISPGAALVGFPPGQLIGMKHLGDATAAAAKASLLTAYNDAAGRLGPAVLPGNLSGLTFTPGLYKNQTSVMLTAGNCTLDAQGDSNGVFVFQMGSTLTTIAGTQIVLSGGAKATNVYWAVGTSATLGTNSKFKGTLLVGSAITLKTGASLEGRVLAQGAAVALDTNAITVPAP